MGLLIILSVVFSVLAGFLNPIIGFSNGSLTYFPVMLILLTGIVIIIKRKKIEPHRGFYFLIYLSLLVMVMATYKTGVSVDIIKMAVYQIMIVFLINLLKYEMLKSIYKIIIVIGAILTIDISIAAIKVVEMGINMVNIRHYTLMDKQYINMLFTIAIPICLMKWIVERKRNYGLLLAIFIITSTVVMQIKTLFISLGLSSVILLAICNVINKKKLIINLCIASVFVVFGFTLFKGFLPQQLVISIDYLLGKTAYLTDQQYRYLDTFFIREAILDNAITIFKDNFMLGIGTGNYAETTQGYNLNISLYARQIDQLPEVTENGIISLLVENGIIVTLLHIVIILLIFKQFFKNKTYDTISLITYNILLSLFISNFFQDNNSNFLYWFFIGASIFLLNNREEVDQIVAKDLLNMNSSCRLSTTRLNVTTRTQ